MMLKIGITGGIGSGKTTVCKVFETLGIPVFYADTVAKQIMTTDPILIDAVKNTFGVQSYTPEGVLNNKYVAQIVFNQPAELAKLNAIVHPAVFRAFEEWTKTYKLCDENILVLAPEHLKITRVKKRDQVSEEQVLARMSKQFSDEEKSAFTKLHLINDEQQSIVSQVMTYHHQFLKNH
jgi:dephospho-CoA kinase